MASCRIDLFLIVIHRFSLVKAAMKNPRFCKVAQNASISSFFNCQRRNKDHGALVNCGGVEFCQQFWVWYRYQKYAVPVQVVSFFGGAGIFLKMFFYNVRTLDNGDRYHNTQ